MPCEEFEAEVQSLQALWDKTNKEGEGLPESETGDIRRSLVEITRQIQQAAAELNKCLEEHRVPPPPIVAEPEDLLVIEYVNPDAPTIGDWANQIVKGAHPFDSSHQHEIVDGSDAFPGNERKEWKQVLAPDDEYDEKLVGATGWVIQPEFSGGDVPFTHPFGNDWEFFLALDGPQRPLFPEVCRPLQSEWEDLQKQWDATKEATKGLPKSETGDLDRQLVEITKSILEAATKLNECVKNNSPPPPPPSPYSFLLATANAHDSAASKRADDLGMPPRYAVLGVEMDSGLIPADFVRNVQEGDRVAVFGRWIVDSAHFYPAVNGFRAEIHPPLLMSCARRVMNASDTVTRALFTSRPYLVGQTFTTDPDAAAYLDGVSDDGYLKEHMITEIEKVNVGSSSVEAHPKIKSKPFKGTHRLHFIITPPERPSPVVGSPASELAVSFQFTVRTGCSVDVTSDGSSVNVVIVLDDTGYTPPPLPERRKVHYSIAALSAQQRDVADAVDQAKWYSGLLDSFLLGGVVWAPRVQNVLDSGVDTSKYSQEALVNTKVLDATHAVRDVSPSRLPAAAGVVKDDNQPFPVYGWVEVRWATVDRHLRFLADITGDGRADIVGFGDDGVWVSLSQGDGTFTAPRLVVGNFGAVAGGW
jgi:hypothetical protein